MTAIADSGSRWLRPAARAFDALSDPARRERTVLLLLAGFVAAWTIYGALAKGSQDIHADVGEFFGWSRDFSLGYNHPPLGAWITGAWFWIFPRADWAAYLLAAVNLGITLWVCWKLFGDWLDDGKRVAALALLTLTPFYSFQALVYNANSAQMPFWAAVTLFFLRAFKRNDWRLGALTGLGAALGMLTKYWAIFLIAGLGIAALIDPRRRRFLASPVPWVMAAVGLLVLAPHLIWLAGGHSSTFDYATQSLPANPALGLLRSYRYPLTAIAYMLPVILAVALMRPNRAAVRDMLLPSDQDRRLMSLALFIALLLPFFTNFAFSSRLLSLWTMPNWSLLPIVLLGTPLLAVTREHAVRILTVAFAFPLIAVAVAPAVAFIIHRNNSADGSARNRLVAHEVETEWRKATARPMRFIAGENVRGIAFYIKDAPSPIDSNDVVGTFRWIPRDRIAADGIAIVCWSDNGACIKNAARYGQGRQSEVELHRDYLGVAGRAQRYLLIVVPPRA